MQGKCSWFRLLFYKKEIMTDKCLQERGSLQQGKATPADKLQATPSGMPQATLPGMPQATLPGMPQATLPGMPQATPPAIFFQISKIFNFSNNLPQATPRATPQAIFEKNFALGPCLRQF
ncbi:hypothetical protein T05_1671 [Trichinella murrelli]|uniref:Uncharacterized protein n=1 Tax=Trichinella murrelli TaxID=144512 RepID=A0A0V0T3L2_9BILA|nr:hypothetical protein T05_1671 [Trichinella murrelli]